MAEPEKTGDAKTAKGAGKPAEKPQGGEEKKPEAGGEAAAAPAAEAPKSAGAKSSMLPLIAVGGMLVIMPVAGFFAAKMALAPKLEKIQEQLSKTAKAMSEGTPVEEESHEKTNFQTEERSPDKNKGKKGEKGESKEAAKEHVEPFHLPEIIVNVAGTRGTRFLRAGIDFEGAEAVTTELAQRKGQILDIVATALASKRLEELETTTIRQQLRDEIISLVNAVLKGGTVENVYFTDLVIQ